MPRLVLTLPRELPVEVPRPVLTVPRGLAVVEVPLEPDTVPRELAVPLELDTVPRELFAEPLLTVVEVPRVVLPEPRLTLLEPLFMLLPRFVLVVPLLAVPLTLLLRVVPRELVDVEVLLMLSFLLMLLLCPLPVFAAPPRLTLDMPPLLPVRVPVLYLEP